MIDAEEKLHWLHKALELNAVERNKFKLCNATTALFVWVHHSKQQFYKKYYNHVLRLMSCSIRLSQQSKEKLFIQSQSFLTTFPQKNNARSQIERKAKVVKHTYSEASAKFLKFAEESGDNGLSARPLRSTGLARPSSVSGVLDGSPLIPAGISCVTIHGSKSSSLYIVCIVP